MKKFIVAAVAFMAAAASVVNGMTEKHYAHLAPSYVADTIRAHFPTLGIAEESTVTPIPGKRPRVRTVRPG
jgi:hypothetical protein